MTTQFATPRAGEKTPSKTSVLITLTRQTFLDRWILPTVVAALMVGMGVLTGALWPSLEGSLQDLPSNLTDNLGKALAGADLTSAAGWVNAEFLSAVAPLGVIAVAVISIVAGLVREEQSKALGVLLAMPVERSVVLVSRVLAAVLHVIVVALGVVAGLVVGSWIGDLGLGSAGIIGSGLHMAALGVAFVGVGALVGAITADARLTVAITAGVAGASFAASAVLPLIDSVADLVRISPWYYATSSNPLVNGTDPVDVGVLVALALVLIAAAAAVFARRDLRG